MEDNSYVNLSLEKYNELYDKAKKFDELSEKFGDELKETISTMIENINKIFATDNDDEEDSEETEDTEFKVGDKVKLVRLNNYTIGFSKGDICTITNLQYNYTKDCIEIKKGDILTGYVSKKDIEKIKEDK